MEYKGYDVNQNDNYIWISKEGNTVFLCECSKVLSDRKLKAVVDDFIKFTVGLREVLYDLEKE